MNWLQPDMNVTYDARLRVCQFSARFRIIIAILIKKILFVRRTPKVSLVGVVFRAESLFSRTSAVQF